MRDWAGDAYVPAVTKGAKPTAKLTIIYSYYDAEGKLRHQTLRYEPKMFRQRRPALEGEQAGNKRAGRDREGNWWIWSLAGITPVLYRLPQLLAKPEDMVFIFVEEMGGEQSTLIFLGLGQGLFLLNF